MLDLDLECGFVGGLGASCSTLNVIGAKEMVSPTAEEGEQNPKKKRTDTAEIEGFKNMVSGVVGGIKGALWVVVWVVSSGLCGWYH
jgi:hypothetical protein